MKFQEPVNRYEIQMKIRYTNGFRTRTTISKLASSPEEAQKIAEATVLTFDNIYDFRVESIRRLNQ